MPAWRKTLLALLVPVLMTLALSTAALADKHSAFLEFSAGDLTDFEIWDDSHFSPTGELYYNRVDGLLLYMGMKYRSDTQLHPRLKAVWGWPSSRSDSYYQLHIEQPIHSQDSFSFGVSLYNRSAWSREDAETISDFGNNVQAFWARIDDRDYFRQDGVTVFAQHKATTQLTLRGEYRSHQLESLSESQSVWTPFQNDDQWRENPPLMVGVLKSAREFEGRMSSYVWSAEYDSRDEDAKTGWWARGIAEYGGRAAGGNYKFRKHTFEGAKLFPITSTQTLGVFGMWGISNGTDFPSHKLFHLGGRGNLRGYDYKEFSGKNILFGRVEYRVQMTEPLEMVYFLESGQVGYSTSIPESDDSDGHKHDAGIGFRFEAPWDGWWGIDVAKAMEEESDIKVYLSLLLVH
ncbi:MAG: BamA/TamA family outer membrane protein [Candidatus Eisenbacteria bacterium]